MDDEADLVIAGCGLTLDHVTAEIARAVRRAPAVLYSRYHDGAKAALRRMNARARLVVQEEGEYRVGDFRPAMYRRIAERIVRVAERHPGAVSLHPGSAIVVDSITQYALEEAERRGLRVRVLPGISSVESILAALRLEIADGLQIILAQCLVAHRTPLASAIDALVLQPAYHDTRWNLGVPVPRPGKLRPLLRILQRSHSASAPVAAIRLGRTADDVVDLLWFELKNLDRLAARITPLHTLFLPRTTTPRPNARVVRSIDSLADARRLVATRGKRILQLDDSSLEPLDERTRAHAERLAAWWSTERTKRGAMIRA